MKPYTLIIHPSIYADPVSPAECNSPTLFVGEVGTLDAAITFITDPRLRTTSGVVSTSSVQLARALALPAVVDPSPVVKSNKPYYRKFAKSRY